MFSVLITTHASTLRIEVSSSCYHAESEFYILHTKVNGVRIQMCYFICVTGFRPLVSENSTLSRDNCEGGHRVTFVRAYIYRVVPKSLRDFRTRLRNNQDRQGRKEHIKGRESLQVFFVLGALVYFQVPPLRGSRDEKWRSQ